jgi:hypothetical protein
VLAPWPSTKNTPYPFTIFTFRLTVEFTKEFGGASQMAPNLKKKKHNNKKILPIFIK